MNYCDDGHVAVGSCESGMNPNCVAPAENGKKHFTGLYCCPIGKNDGSPIW